MAENPAAPGLPRLWPELLAWAALAALLVAGLPLFVCMPLNNDATLYDLAARNILRGGVHYRDMFDTNLPGMVWLHAGVRSLFGWRSEVLRLADLVVVAGIVGLLLAWLRPLGLARGDLVWVAFVLAAYYLSTTEWCHCQRDTWMLLPALAALHLRRRQAAELAIPGATWRRPALRALAEGLLWGAAFWIKPHVAVPALACWLVATVQVVRAPGRSVRLLLLDAACLLAGGLLAGAAGVLWLWTSGAWPHFWDVFLHWNTEYLGRATPPPLRFLRMMLDRLWPWNLAHWVAGPVAVVTLFRALAGRPRPADGQLLLAPLYLGWVAQAVLFQKLHDYTLAPGAMLALAVVVGLVWRLRRSVPAWLAVAAFAALAAVFHPVLRPDRLALWPRCWQEGSTAELRDRLTLLFTEHTPNWEQLERVADYLRSRGVGDGELTCYNNTPHSLYLALGVEPAVPYMHFDMVLVNFAGKRELIRRQLAASRQRFVVSDLYPLVGAPGPAEEEWPGRPLALPPQFPPEWADVFPWTEPVVFRAGRYLVHEVTGPPERLLPERGGSRHQ